MHALRGLEAIGLFSVLALVAPACGDDSKSNVTPSSTGGVAGSSAGNGTGGSSMGGKGGKGGTSAGQSSQAGTSNAAGEGGEAGDASGATGGGGGLGGASGGNAGSAGRGGASGAGGTSGDAGGGGEGGDAPVGPVRDPRCDDATTSSLQGSGSSQDPYLLCLPDQLLLLDTGSYTLDRSYELGDELDLGELTSPPSTFGTPFTGTLDGQSHALTNLPGALFTAVMPPGEIVDLVISGDVDASMQGTSWGLLTRSNAGTLRRVRASGTLAVGSHVGILLGTNTGIVEDCSSSGAITSGGAHIGGLVGVNTGTVRRSFSTASVTAGSRVGGLVGRQTEPGVIEESYALGNVTGSLSVGGLLGTFFGGTVRNSYARSGTVSGPEAGGLVGFISGTEGTPFVITNSYAASTVSGTGAEGLVGMVEGALTYDVSGCYFLDTASGTLGIALSAQEMRMESSFSGWDFDDVWKLDAASSSFPSLAFETP